MDQWLKGELAEQNVKDLTAVQKAAVDAGITTGTSMVVCAPTSSGKTLIGEIAILAGIRNRNTALYLVSHKALADQKFEEFTQKYGSKSKRKVARVAISTGDRDEGDDEPQVIIATYEKALSLVMGGELDVGTTIVIADELQLMGEDKRGPEVEILCSALRRRKPKQFVALTATIENGDDLSGWLECRLIKSSIRDVALIQEIWTEKETYSIAYGQEEGEAGKRDRSSSLDTLDVLNELLQRERGPILVFVETRSDAMQLAAAFASKRGKTPSGFNLAEQLSLFSEATEFSDRLCATAETKVVFHTADLTPSERAVVEQGLITSNFDVCFATPTLAAGVNFPFRTVVFDRLRRRYIPPPLLPLSNYRNMSGRAGRLGMHSKGFSVLLPRDEEELQHANKLVRSENERLHSKLASISVRKIVLALIASGTADGKSSIQDFLQQTFFWYQVRERNPKRLEELTVKIDEAIAWLAENKMIESREGVLKATDLGSTSARTGLLPTTSAAFATLLSCHAEALEKGFEDLELPLIYAMTSCDEFDSEVGQRFIPSIPRGTDSTEVLHTFRGLPTLLPRKNAPLGNAAFAVYLFASGEIERRISARCGIPSGQVHRFAGDVGWVLDGLTRIAAVPTVACSQKVMNAISILARRVQYGVPTAVIDLLRTAQRAGVPGFGRQRAIALLKAKLADRENILRADRAVLEKILLNKSRVDRLIEAIERSEPSKFEAAKRLHCRIGAKLGIEALVRDAYDKYNAEYELPIENLLKLDREWTVTKLDDGRRQGVPDLMIQFGERSVILECKSTTKRPPAINKEEAFDVLTKAADIRDVHCVTLGKPGFDTFSEAKACGSDKITLINHATFISALLLRRKGEISLGSLFDWLCEPGAAELERLGILTD